MLRKGWGDVWDPVPHVRGPGVGQGLLLEVRGALKGHFWAKFRKQKLLGTKGLVGVILVWNFTLVFTSQSVDPGRFCSRGPLADWSQTWYKFWP